MTKEKTNHPELLSQEKSQERRPLSEAERAIRARMDQEAAAYFVPGTTVYKNKYRLTNSKSLNEACSRDVEKERQKIRLQPAPGRFDSSYLMRVHKQMFSKSFEWAGHTRDYPFTFKDGTVAALPYMRKKGFKKAFAAGSEVQNGLQKLDDMLMSNDELRQLTYEQFTEHAAHVWTHLHALSPFREGNRRAAETFMEKMAQVAGYDLDLSNVSKKRKDSVRAAAVDDGNVEAVRHLIEDVSNPQRLHVLGEFVHEMRSLGLDEKNYPMVVGAREGQTYNGVCRGVGPDGFAIDCDGTIIVGSKRDLPPERVKTLRIGDYISFTAPPPQLAEQILIPREDIPSLSNEELAQRVRDSDLIKNSQQRIRALCKIVYGNGNALQSRLPRLEIPVTNAGLEAAERFARQVEESPGSFARVCGVSFFGLKNGRRRHAEHNFMALGHAIKDYVRAHKDAQWDIQESHAIEQKRCRQSLQVPNTRLQNLFFLPKGQRQHMLDSDPALRWEARSFFYALNERLSQKEQALVRRRDYAELAKSLGTSVTQAANLSTLLQRAQETYNMVQERSREMQQQQMYDVHPSVTDGHSKRSAEVSETQAQQSQATTSRIAEATRQAQQPQATTSRVAEATRQVQQPQAITSQATKQDGKAVGSFLGKVLAFTKKSRAETTEAQVHTTEPGRKPEVGVTEAQKHATEPDRKPGVVVTKAQVHATESSPKSGYVQWEGGTEDAAKIDTTQTSQDEVTKQKMLTSRDSVGHAKASVGDQSSTKAKEASTQTEDIREPSKQEKGVQAEAVKEKAVQTRDASTQTEAVTEHSKQERAAQTETKRSAEDSVRKPRRRALSM